MPSVTVKTNKYHSFSNVVFLIHSFIVEKALRSGAYSLSLDHAAQEIALSRKEMGLTKGRMILYIMIHFYPEESSTLTLDDADAIARSISEYYRYEYQLVYGVHNHEGCWYIHFAINPLNFCTGANYSMSPTERKHLQENVMLSSGFHTVNMFIN